MSNRYLLLGAGLIFGWLAPYTLALGQQVNPNNLNNCEGEVSDWHFCWGSLKKLAPKGVETSYVGEFQEGTPSGLGALRINFPDKGEKTFYGEFSEGRPFGQGLVIAENGSRQFGIWEAKKFEPFPALRFVAASKLSLAFFKGLAMKGEVIDRPLISFSHNPNGLRYCKKPSGFFTSGIGTQCWGAPIIGVYGVQFILDRKLFIYPSGTVYEGENVKYDDRLELAPVAFGQLKFKDGRRYVGQFRNGLPNGLGLLIDHVGTIKAGEWGGNFELKNEIATAKVMDFLGNPQKFVTTLQVPSVTQSDSRVATFNANSLVINPAGLPSCDQVSKPFHERCWGTKTYLLGNRYEGEWLNGKREGYGIFEDSDGKRVGIFKNNLSDRGTYRLKSGDVWVGHAATSAFTSPQHGEGILFTKDGDWREGLWKDGTLLEERPTSQVEQSFFPIDEATLEFRKRAIALGRFSLTPSNFATLQDSRASLANGSILGGNASSEQLLSPPLDKDTSGVQLSKEVTNEVLKSTETTSPLVKLPRVKANDNETVANTVEVEKITSSTPQSGDIKTQVSDERRVALVIGNAAYRSAPLDNPLNDATDIANELKRRGFKLIARNNANLRSLQQAVRDFSDEFKKSDVGLIYYSGHGVETKGQNYLIPVDADIRKEYELSAQAYPASQLTAMMEEIQSSDDKKRVAILILDACRDNPLTRSWRSSGRGLARMDAPAGTFISFSTAPGSVAADGRGRNSPFTKHLLQAMRKPDVPIELMFKEVRVGVMGETKGKQIPWDSSSLTGDFYFSRSIRDNPN